MDSPVGLGRPEPVWASPACSARRWSMTSVFRTSSSATSETRAGGAGLPRMSGNWRAGHQHPAGRLVHRQLVVKFQSRPALPLERFDDLAAGHASRPLRRRLGVQPRRESRLGQRTGRRSLFSHPTKARQDRHPAARRVSNTLDDILQLPLQSVTVGIGDPRVPQENGGTVRPGTPPALFPGHVAGASTA